MDTASYIRGGATFWRPGLRFANRAQSRDAGKGARGRWAETPLKSPLDPTWKVSVAIRDSAAFEAKKWKCISDTLGV